MTDTTIRIGTRGSTLALVQAHLVLDALANAHPDHRFDVVTVKTAGDKDRLAPLRIIGGAGAFTAELEEALLDGRVDVAVHSLKDLPTHVAPGLCVGAVPQRDDTRDALITRTGCTLKRLRRGAVVGTGSARRRAQLLAMRHDLKVQEIRGNVETRLRKVRDGDYDAAVLAYAGLRRLDMTDVVAEVFDHDVMLPAPAQGAIGVECRDEPACLALVEPIDDAGLRAAVQAERAFLDACGGGCHMPVGAHAYCEGTRVLLQASIAAEDGSETYRGERSGRMADAEALGRGLARELLERGAADIVDAILKARTT